MCQSAMFEVHLNERDRVGQARALYASEDLGLELSSTVYALDSQVELFFTWIKQHLQIKRFFGTSENAVQTQIWIAV